MIDNEIDPNILDAIQNEPEIVYEDDQVVSEPSPEIVLEDEETEAPEEHLDEQVEDERQKPRKPRVPAKTRINDLSRKYHTEARERAKAEEALTKLREENDRLKRLSESQNKSVISSQESMIDSSILHAQQLQRKAIEDGDIDAQVNAQAALAAAYADKRQLDAFKMQQKLAEEDRQYQEERQKQRPSAQHQAVEDEVEATPEAREWVSENQWFDENSDDYDPDLHQKAFSYAQYLDRQYARNGKQDRIGSYEYFDDLDRYMSRHLQPVTQRQSTQGGLVMNRPKAPVAGVSRSGSPQSGQRERLVMTRAEQDMARAHGWTDEQWFKNKKLAETMKKNNRLIVRSN
jgi:hypothetical protein